MLTVYLKEGIYALLISKKQFDATACINFESNDEHTFSRFTRWSYETISTTVSIFHKHYRF
jgi:hypothetical protein